MNAIVVRKRIDSTTLDLPELSDFVGKHVELVVIERTEMHSQVHNLVPSMEGYEDMMDLEEAGISRLA